MSAFHALDVETANADRASICQIGVVEVQDGRVKREWKTLVDPEDEFDPFNTYIHGITEDDVSGSPTIPEIQVELRKQLDNAVVASHTSFDRVAIERAFENYNIPQMQIRWMDSAKVARRAWPERFGVRGYALKNVAKELEIALGKHHDALDDAKASAGIILKACADLQLDVEGVFELATRRRTRKRTYKYPVQSVRRKGNPDGPLHGECVVFTGKLCKPRTEMADAIAELGCDVANDVTKAVTLLVVGSYNRNVLRGHQRSSKHRKAIRLAEKGAEIRIVTEDDLEALMVAAKAEMA